MKAIIPLLLMTIITVCGCKPTSENARVEDGTATDNGIPLNGSFSQGSVSVDYRYLPEQDKTQLTVNSGNSEKYEVTGKVSKYFFSDVNADEVDELFVISTDKNQHNHLAAWLVKNAYPLQIYIPETTSEPTGTATYSAQNGQIVRKHTTTDTKGTKTVNEIRYNLVSGEATLSLLPQGWTTEQLQRMVGQYASKTSNDNGQYKIMMIGVTEFGEWTLDLYVKDQDTKTVICEYHGIGQWQNRDLYVPLKSADDTHMATMAVRIVGLNASLYTTRSADATAFVTYCDGKGSFAGNYKKTDITEQ